MSLSTGADSVVLTQQISWKVLNCLDIFLGTQDIVKIPTVECFFHKTANLPEEDPNIAIFKTLLTINPLRNPRASR